MHVFVKYDPAMSSEEKVCFLLLDCFITAVAIWRNYHELITSSSPLGPSTLYVV